MKMLLEFDYEIELRFLMACAGFSSTRSAMLF